MNSNPITPRHTDRTAVVYVRQSSERQVREHTGSTDRQRALTQTAFDLGWPAERVFLLEDAGVSGAYGSDRPKFKEMLRLIRARQVGVVLFVDQTRSARNEADWGQLVEVAEVTNTLIHCDGHMYDPSNPSDRLTLGITQNMAIADTQQMNIRRRQSILAKAKAGTLRIQLPVGYVRKQGVILIDDRPGVREAIKGVFETFERLGTVRQVVRHYRTQQLTLPRRDPHAADEITWVIPNREVIAGFLKNEVYAGVYAYGRTQGRKQILEDFTVRQSRQDVKNPADWHAFRPGAFEGFIDYATFNRIQERIRANDFRKGQGAPREGAALLQGLAVCGRCGYKMSVQYPDKRRPYYVCARAMTVHAGRLCQQFSGQAVEEAVAEAVLASLTSSQAELAIRALEAFEHEQKDEASAKVRALNRARTEQDELYAVLTAALMRGTAEALLAELERDWIAARARALQAERAYLLNKSTAPILDDHARQSVSRLADDLESVWQSSSTRMEERKALLRCLIESVTITRNQQQLHVLVQWHTGQTTAFVMCIRPNGRPPNSPKATGTQA